MTLSDLERQNRKFYGFFGDFVDFDGPSLDFLGSRKPAHKGIKEWYPRKSRDKMAEDRLTVCEQELL